MYGLRHLSGPVRSFAITFVAILLGASGICEVRGQSVPLLRTVDLAVEETRTVELDNGVEVRVRLSAVEVDRDNLADAVRRAVVNVAINGQAVTLECGNYNLPVTVGSVQVDCPIVRDYMANSGSNRWGIEKDARLRLWPAHRPWIAPETFQFPVRQRWFASGTQMSNEPVFINGGDTPDQESIYYHSGLDLGGVEGMDTVVAATDGIVLTAAGETAETVSVEDTPVRPRYDVIYIKDDRGWYYRYSHLASVDVEVGQKVTMGEPIGVLGKEGASGGWAHLHFEIKSRQPSGDWGTQDGYAFLWQAYHQEKHPSVTAVARPHRLVEPGHPVQLDGRRSRVLDGDRSFRWRLHTGTSVGSETARLRYDEPGTYSEVLKVTDGRGNIDYDFQVVQVVDPEKSLPPTIHAAFHPTQDIQPGEEITFKVRTFRIGAEEGKEVWDFGDGSEPVTVQSDGNHEAHAPDGYAVTTHSYEEPGHYLVTVRRTDSDGYSATTHLHVPVGQ